MARRLLNRYEGPLPREALVILHCNFEELRALSSAGEMIVADASTPEGGVATEVDISRIESLLPRLTGDVSIETLEDQRNVRDAVAAIRAELLRRLDERIVEYHPAHEEALSLYFDYGYSYAVLERLDRMGTEMEALLALMTGGRGMAEATRTFTFPD